ncbi:hypothetical protein LCGC14_1815910 [marine sediment metagenome]|uniref:Uncharacterized protein n=1 Tax=marine sediment metagenome TaxID=412755 RepID=A0A0F9GKH6_9ZZZZ
MTNPYTRSVTLFAAGSDLVSATVLVADARSLTLSVESDTTIAVNWVLDGSNEEGFDISINTFSTLSTIVADGIHKIDEGVRWVRLTRDSAISQPNAIIEYRT